MTSYCLGFIFDREMSTVVLIKPKKGPYPGKWNGVGGHIEEHERPDVAMARECFEETGIATKPSDWDWVGTITISGSFVFAYALSTDYGDTSTLTDSHEEYEEIRRVALPNLFNMELAPHVGSLVMVSLDMIKHHHNTYIAIREK